MPSSPSSLGRKPSDSHLEPRGLPACLRGARARAQGKTVGGPIPGEELLARARRKVVGEKRWAGVSRRRFGDLLPGTLVGGARLAINALCTFARGVGSRPPLPGPFTASLAKVNMPTDTVAPIPQAQNGLGHRFYAVRPGVGKIEHGLRALDPGDQNATLSGATSSTLWRRPTSKPWVPQPCISFAKGRWPADTPSFGGQGGYYDWALAARDPDVASMRW